MAMRDRTQQTDRAGSTRKPPGVRRGPSPSEYALAPPIDRSLLTPTVLLALQRTAGNTAVARLTRTVPIASRAGNSSWQLQDPVGNAAVASLLVVQRALIPLDAQDKPGRLRDEERTLK